MKDVENYKKIYGENTIILKYCASPHYNIVISKDPLKMIFLFLYSFLLFKAVASFGRDRNLFALGTA
jgi:hypothetical protein